MTSLQGFKTTVRLTSKNKERTDLHSAEYGSTLNCNIRHTRDNGIHDFFFRFEIVIGEC